MYREDAIKYFAGLDVGLNETALCVVDEAGSIVREGRAGSEPAALAAWLAAANVELQRVGLEAGPLSPWLYEGLRAAGLRAVCIGTRRMKGAMTAMAVKTDRNDAYPLPNHLALRPSGWAGTRSCT